MSFFSRLFSRKAEPVAGSPEFNDGVRRALAGFGDDGSEIRHVLHYAYPEEDADPNGRIFIVDELRMRGFDVRDANAGDGLVLEHYESVAGDAFDGLTADLSAFFAARGWDYDGWECAVSVGESQSEEDAA